MCRECGFPGLPTLPSVQLRGSEDGGGSVCVVLWLGCVCERCDKLTIILEDWMARGVGVRVWAWAVWVVAGGRWAAGECMGVGGSSLLIPGDAVLTLLLPLHHGPNCSQVGLTEVQVAEATQMAVRKVNEAGLVPGVSLGLRVVDTCGVPSFTTKMAAVAWVEDSLACPLPALTLAILGPNDVSIASSAGVVVRPLGVPLLSYGPRSVPAPPSLDIITPAPYRIAQAVVQVLTGAGVSAVSVVHTDDAEGETLAQHLVEAADYWYVCVAVVVTGTGGEVMAAIRGGPGAVVVLGSRHHVQLLVRTLGQPGSPVDLLLLTEGGPMPQVELGDVTVPTIILQRTAPVLPEFLTFLERDLAAEDTPRRHYLAAVAECASCPDGHFGYDAAAPAAVDVVLRCVAALRDAHMASCGGKEGLCNKLNGLGVDAWEELLLSSTPDTTIFPELAQATLSSGTEDLPHFTVKLLHGGNLTQAGQADATSAILGEMELPELGCGGGPCSCKNYRPGSLPPAANITRPASGFNIFSGSDWWSWELPPLHEASGSELTVYVTAFSMVVLILLISAMVCTYNIVKPPPRN